MSGLFGLGDAELVSEFEMARDRLANIGLNPQSYAYKNEMSRIRDIILRWSPKVRADPGNSELTANGQVVLRGVNASLDQLANKVSGGSDAPSQGFFEKLTTIFDTTPLAKPDYTKDFEGVFSALRTVQERNSQAKNEQVFRSPSVLRLPPVIEADNSADGPFVLPSAITDTAKTWGQSIRELWSGKPSSASASGEVYIPKPNSYFDRNNPYTPKAIPTEASASDVTVNVNPGKGATFERMNAPEDKRKQQEELMAAAEAARLKKQREDFAMGVAAAETLAPLAPILANAFRKKKKKKKAVAMPYTPPPRPQSSKLTWVIGAMLLAGGGFVAYKAFKGGKTSTIRRTYRKARLKARRTYRRTRRYTRRRR